MSPTQIEAPDDLTITDGALEVTVSSSDLISTVQLVGALEITNSATLARELKRLGESQAGRVLVDLARLDFIDSSGVSVLVDAWRNAEGGREGRLLFLRGTGQVARVIAISDLEPYLPFVDEDEHDRSAAGTVGMLTELECSGGVDGANLGSSKGPASGAKLGQAAPIKREVGDGARPAIANHSLNPLDRRGASLSSQEDAQPFAERSSSAERGSLVSDLSREIVKLHARLYGRGPTKARSFLHRDYAICILEEILTTADKTLIDSGSASHVQDTRLKFQDAVKPQFIEIGERITGRKVRVFLSQVDVHADLSVELFLFEPEAESGTDG